MSAFSVNAATGGKLFGAVLITDNNRFLAKEVPIAASAEVQGGNGVSPLPSPSEFRREYSSKIINEKQLQEGKFSSATNIPAKKKKSQYRIPENRTNNGDLVIFTKPDESGWHLKEGDRLTIRYELDLHSNRYSDSEGEWMEIGFVKNGTMLRAYAEKAKTFTYTIQADEEGDYYFYAVNASAGYILISSGTIS